MSDTPIVEVTLPGGKVIKAYGITVASDGTDASGTGHLSVFSGNGGEHLSFDTTPEGAVMPETAHYTPPKGKPIVGIDMADFDPN